MKSPFRSTLAALLAALAFACVGLGERGSGGEAAHAPSLRDGARTGVLTEREAISLAFLQGGRPIVAAPGIRTGAVPRVGPGAGPSAVPHHGIAETARRAASTARIRPTLLPPFARHLCAARDGTLSARSTGVPPPALA